jgi:hypothetical protein
MFELHFLGVALIRDDLVFNDGPAVVDYSNLAGGIHSKKPDSPVTRRASKCFAPEPREKRNRIMTRNILSLIMVTTLAAAVSLKAEPTPTPKPTSSQNANKVERQKPRAKTKAALKIVPSTPLAEGWNNVNGEWIHSDGYKYINGQVIRTGAQTHKAPPKPPAKALLKSAKPKPTPSPDPNSAAAKAAQKEKNLRQIPAPQTGTHL